VSDFDVPVVSYVLLYELARNRAAFC